MNNGFQKTTTEYNLQQSLCDLKRCKVQKTHIQGVLLSLLLSWLKFDESWLLLILRPMYADSLSMLRNNDFCCVFRYCYGVNVNTE